MPKDSLSDRVARLEKQLKQFSALPQRVNDLDERVGELEEFTGELEVAEFKITQGDNMPINGVAPGSTGTFTATPIDGNGNVISLPAGAQPPRWTSSDTDNAPVTASADGLSATVAVPSTTQGGSFTLNVDSPDLPNDPSGSAQVPILFTPPPPPQVASFRIDQTA
jgi:hypothetical protein